MPPSGGFLVFGACNMSLYKKFETSKKLSEQGARLEFSANEDGTIPTFIIARAHMGNQRYAKVISEVFPTDIAVKLNKMEKAEVDKLELTAFVRANLLGWENILGRDEQPLDFNEDNALALFTDLPEVYGACYNFARDINNYLKVNEEASVKN